MSLWSFWASCPGCGPSQDLAYPQPAGAGNAGESTDAVPVLLSSSQNTFLAACAKHLHLSQTQHTCVGTLKALYEFLFAKPF